MAKTLRLELSVVAISLVIAVLVHAWRNKKEQPGFYRVVRWVGLAFILEALRQILGLAFGMPTGLMIAYTIVAIAFWALLVALLVTTAWK